MTQRLTPGTAALLVTAPLLWAGNAVVGRLVHAMIPPITLNFFRWVLAFAILLPLAHGVLRADSPLWPHWRRYALLGLLGIGAYNALQYMALQTSTPINVTLVGSSMPVWMLAVGALFFGAAVTRRQVLGALLSVCGVLLVLSRGEWSQLLAFRLVPGDLFMLLATISWAFYSWLLSRTSEPTSIRGDWAAFLMAQMVFGLAWSGSFAGAEWASGRTHIEWGWPLIAALAFIAVGPAVLAYRCWGVGVQRAGPAVAGFFANLTPLFAALMSAAFLGEMPRTYHALAFALIVGGIAMLAIERFRPKPQFHSTDEVTLPRALAVGLFQCIAMIPGVSRAGATIMGGMLMGIDRKTATEFSFFLAIPTMIAATAYDLYKNWHDLSADGAAVIGIGFLCAFLTALLVVRTAIAAVAAVGLPVADVLLEALPAAPGDRHVGDRDDAGHRRAGQASAERLHRKLQRPAQG